MQWNIEQGFLIRIKDTYCHWIMLLPVLELKDGKIQKNSIFSKIKDELK